MSDLWISTFVQVLGLLSLLKPYLLCALFINIIIAQHLDDCAESFFMSIMHNGFIRTMKAAYEINAGGISVIRPLVYCRESLMTEFVSEHVSGLAVLDSGLLTSSCGIG